MHAKRLCKWFFPCLLIILLTFGMPGSISAETITSLKISPTYSIITDCPANELEIVVRVENVIDLYAYHLEISFTPGVVEVLDVQNGIFLEEGFMEPTNAIDNVTGKILFGMVQINPSLPKTGSGDLVIIRLRAVALFLSSPFEIDALESDLVHWEDYQPIPFVSYAGTVTTIGCVAFNTFLPVILD